ncbi:MAG: trypsin-like peptidase domain-containing protein [Planctomycetes bacterium]|nr:trypsin-like peptidase domain-containing protein [Planctomycetota bacterium]
MLERWPILGRSLAAVALVLAAPQPAWVEEEAARDLARARQVERRVQALIERVAPAVVTVGVEDDEAEGGPLRSGGSGVVIEADDAGGWVLTNDHVTAGHDQVRVGLPDGRLLTGRVTGRDTTGDIALVRVVAAALPAARLGDSEAVRPGQPVVAMGNPFGLAGDDHEPAATLGVVSAVNRYQGGEKVYGDALQVDAAVNPGNSGGPLFDLDGRVIGITGRISVRGGVRHNVGVGFAIPAHQIAIILDALKAGQAIHRGWLGVRFLSTTDGAPGALVREVVPGSPADVGGLRAGDRIVGVQDKAVDHPVRLQNHLSILPAGTEVGLRLVRQGREVEVKVRLGPRPEAP